MSAESSGGIFLCYRHADAPLYAEQLRLRLEQRFPGAYIFMDKGSIEPGVDFADVIREALESSVLLLAVIGRQWAAADERGTVVSTILKTSCGSRSILR